MNNNSTNVTSSTYCDNCLIKIKQGNKLKCGHLICRNCLVRYASGLWLWRLPYNYMCSCYKCNDTKKVKSVELTCGCKKEINNKKVKYSILLSDINSIKCSSRHSLYAIDVLLINDYESLKLVALMLTQHPEISDLPLEAFYTSLKKEDAETIAWIIENTKAIKKLDFNDGKFEKEKTKVIITALEKNNTITILNISNSNLYLLQDNMILLDKIIKSNKSLKELNLSHNNINYKGIEIIRKALEKNETLEVLNLANNSIEEVGIANISEILKKNKTLKELNLRWNQITDEGWKNICIALRVNNTLEVLDLGSTNIKILHYIRDVLMCNRGLVKLNLEFNSLCENSIKETCNGLCSNKTLKYLNLAENCISNINIIANMLKINHTLIELNIESNRISCGDIKLLYKALTVNKSLKKLYINNNDLKAECLKEIAKALKANRTLTVLNIGNNKIPDKIFKSICKAVTINKSITYLGLWNSRIGNNNMIIGELLKGNKVLTQLNLDNNKLGNKPIEYLSEGLRYNTALKELYLQSNNIGNDGAEAISRALKSNSSLSKLNLERNPISTEGGNAIAEALKVNKGLTWLSMKSNGIRAKGFSNIIEAMIDNKTLEHLDLEDNEADCLESFNLMLVANKKLRYVNLENTKLRSLGNDPLLNGLRVNNSLEELLMGFNCIESRTLNFIAVALKVNTALRILSLWGNKIEPKMKLKFINVESVNRKVRITS